MYCSQTKGFTVHLLNLLVSLVSVKLTNSIYKQPVEGKSLMHYIFKYGNYTLKIDTNKHQLAICMNN